MPDNYSNDITDNLVQYLDNEMTDAEKQAFEKLLQQDAVLYERYQFLFIAKQAIRAKGLKEKVSALHKEYIQTQQQSEPEVINISRKSSSFFKNFMRVAAVFIIAIAGYGIFEFSSTNTNAVFNNNFVAYNLPVTRGATDHKLIDSLYNARNYNAVVNAFRITNEKKQEDYFLAAQAYLQLNKTAEAINSLQQVEKMNAESNQQYFIEETDYYLALAYIKAGKINEAQNQLNKITSNKHHLFYDKARNISKLKLEILKLKE